MIHPSLSSQVTGGGGDDGVNAEGAGGALAHAAVKRSRLKAQGSRLKGERVAHP
jgi:hypothetical protein